MQPNPASAAIIQSSGDVDPFSQPFTSWRFAVELARGPTEISSQLTTLLCRLPGLYLRESAASPLCAVRLQICSRQETAGVVRRLMFRFRPAHACAPNPFAAA